MQKIKRYFFVVAPGGEQNRDTCKGKYDDVCEQRLKLEHSHKDKKKPNLFQVTVAVRLFVIYVMANMLRLELCLGVSVAVPSKRRPFIQMYHYSEIGSINKWI